MMRFRAKTMKPTFLEATEKRKWRSDSSTTWKLVGEPLRKMKRCKAKRTDLAERWKCNGEKPQSIRRSPKAKKRRGGVRIHISEEPRVEKLYQKSNPKNSQAISPYHPKQMEKPSQSSRPPLPDGRQEKPRIQGWGILNPRRRHDQGKRMVVGGAAANGGGGCGGARESARASGRAILVYGLFNVLSLVWNGAYTKEKD
jgi:hypothetical protein